MFIIIVHFKTKPNGNNKTPISLTSHLQNLHINCVRCKSLCFSMVLIVYAYAELQKTHIKLWSFTAYFMTLLILSCAYTLFSNLYVFIVSMKIRQIKHIISCTSCDLFLFISSPLLYTYILCLTHSSQVLYKYSKRFMYHNKDS